MDSYNFWQDLLDTFQSSPDWIKALWLLIPPGFVLALIGMVMCYRLGVKRSEKGLDGALVYEVVPEGGEQRGVYDHPTSMIGDDILLSLEQSRSVQLLSQLKSVRPEDIDDSSA